MPVKLKWPWLGIAIPSFLISFIGYNAHYFILSNFLSKEKQVFFQFSLSMIWLSYYLAIYTNPGKPPHLSTQGVKNEKYCRKCKNFKPERAHHCKTCNQCVLMMDHHCPWTMNCVGYFNFPHFIRFLFWIIVTTGFLFIQLCIRIKHIWDHRFLRSATFKVTTKKELIFLTILTPMDVFVLFTITILLIRCIKNQILDGMTQIESWELERLENMYYKRNSKLLTALIEQVWIKYPEEHTLQRQQEMDQLLERKNKHKLRFMTVINFPYDNGFMSNISTALGSSPLIWLWPWGAPQGDGMQFTLNEFSIYEKDSPLEDIILSLPWPPDGGRQGVSKNGQQVETLQIGGEFAIRTNITAAHARNSWKNEWGEELRDFGVDIEAESPYN